MKFGTIAVIFFVVFLAIPAWAIELGFDNISETEGFAVELKESKLTIKNNMNIDAYKVTVLIYRQEDGFQTFKWDDDDKRFGYITVIPAGFSFTSKRTDLNTGASTYKYKARVYYLREYQ